MTTAPQESPLPPAQALCTSCGFCCDGTLFPRVELRAQETLHPLLLAAGTWTAPDGRSSFSQPCVAFRGRCTIYAEGLPHACHVYRCRLLRQCERGVQEWDEAQGLVVRTRQLRDLVRDELRDVLGERDPSVALVDLIHRLMNEPLPATHAAQDTDRVNRLRLQCMALVVTLDDRFRLPKTKVEKANTSS